MDNTTASTIQNCIKSAILALEEKKAQDIVVLDISEVSVMADYFIIANGMNFNQVHALSDYLDKEMIKLGCQLKQTEGYQMGNWILMDYGDFIVHIFDKENRFFYDLERIWRDGKKMDIAQLKESE